MTKNAEFAQQMSEVFHQLNNDLNLVLGQVELCTRAQNRGELDKLPPRLEALQRAAQRLAEHVRGGQLIARKQRDEKDERRTTTKRTPTVNGT